MTIWGKVLRSGVQQKSSVLYDSHAGCRSSDFSVFFVFLFLWGGGERESSNVAESFRQFSLLYIKRLLTYLQLEMSFYCLAFFQSRLSVLWKYHWQYCFRILLYLYRFSQYSYHYHNILLLMKRKEKQPVGKFR